MKFLRINAVNPEYASQFYADRPGLAGLDFEAQRAVLESDHFSLNSLTRELKNLGYEVLEVYPTLQPLQSAWASEAGLDPNHIGVDDIVVAQVAKFQPEIIYYEYNNAAAKLLLRLRSEVGSIKLVLGSEGSALSVGRTWPHFDLILSCAPESLAKLSRIGFRSELLGHAFNPDVNQLLAATPEPIPASFIGGIVRRNQFHLEREKVLLDLVSQIPLRIFSASARAGWKDYAKAGAVSAAYLGVMAMRAVRVQERASRNFRWVRMIERIASTPRLPVNRALSGYLYPPVYGLDFYQVMRDSLVSINIHADSSPDYASNMRLYEATGVGSCLVTDWKSNLVSLFEIDKEVVTYRNGAEAAEKVRWLLDHPKERLEIARQGQQRTLRDYTFAQQAARMDDIIHRRLAG